MNGDVYKIMHVSSDRTYVEIGRFSLGATTWVKLVSVDKESSMPDLMRTSSLPLNNLVKVKSRYEGARGGRCGE